MNNLEMSSWLILSPLLSKCLSRKLIFTYFASFSTNALFSQFSSLLHKVAPYTHTDYVLWGKESSLIFLCWCSVRKYSQKKNKKCRLTVLSRMKIRVRSTKHIMIPRWRPPSAQRSFTRMVEYFCKIIPSV